MPTPSSSQDANVPFCAAQMRGPMPPGPAPRMSDSNIYRSDIASGADAALTKDVAKDIRDLFHDWPVNGVRGRQIDAGQRQCNTIRALTRSIFLIGRQSGKRTEKRADLDVSGGRRLDQAGARLGRHPNADDPYYRLTLLAKRGRKFNTGDTGEIVTILRLQVPISLKSLLDTPPLGLPNGSLQIRHSIVVADPLVPE